MEYFHMDNIKAYSKNLKNVFFSSEDENCFYQVPDYQRPYSWDKEHISELIDDLTSAYTDNCQEEYYCGSLVLVKNEKDNRYDIIDGQQRITTFTILACVIRDLYNNDLNTKSKTYICKTIQDEFDSDKRRLRFLTNEQKQIDFEETILKGIKFEEIVKKEKQFINNRYLQNAYYIKLFLAEKLNNYKININEFVSWLYEKVVLTVITTPNVDSAIKIFNVLNDRGMPLSPMDILKSSLMRNIKQPEDAKAFKATWEKISNNVTNVEGFDFEDMLNTYLYYKLTSNPKERYDKALLKDFEKHNVSPLEAIYEIDKFSQAYIEMINAEDKYIYCLKYLRHKIYWHSIMATAIYSNYPYIQELKKVLVAFYYQNWIAGATIARIKQTSFNILKLVKEQKEIEYIKGECLKNLKSYNTIETFDTELNSPYVYGKSWDRATLLLLEYFSQDNSSQKFIPLNSNLQIEHILPQTITKDNIIWEKDFPDKEKRELVTNSIGNLTLLSMRKNVQASNNSYEEKKKAYKNKDNVITSFVITQKLLDDYPEWNPDALSNRTKGMIQQLKDFLNIF